MDKPDPESIKPHAGEPLDQMRGNFIFDLNLDGMIDKPDRKVVRANKLHSVP